MTLTIDLDWTRRWGPDNLYRRLASTFDDGWAAAARRIPGALRSGAIDVAFARHRDAIDAVTLGSDVRFNHRIPR
jgi:hypothetical protein